MGELRVAGARREGKEGRKVEAHEIHLSWNPHRVGTEEDISTDPERRAEGRGRGEVERENEKKSLWLEGEMNVVGGKDVRRRLTPLKQSLTPERKESGKKDFLLY